MASQVEEFLTSEEEQEIVDAIIAAEQNTSGEIRVHLEASTVHDHYLRAQEVFHTLKMDNTRQRNGVLIYIAVQDHQFVICGDTGIDDVVPDDFWTSTRDTIATHFKSQRFKQGIIEGVLRTGEKLKEHFPWGPNDSNELRDEVSKS